MYLRIGGYVIGVVGIAIIFFKIIEDFASNNQFNSVLIWLPIIGAVLVLISIFIVGKTRITATKQTPS